MIFQHFHKTSIPILIIKTAVILSYEQFKIDLKKGFKEVSSFIVQ